MLVHIQINPRGEVLYKKNFSKFIFAQNGYILLKLIKQKKGYFNPISKFQVLQQDFTSKRTFFEKDRYALHLSYATLVTYVSGS